MGGSQGLLPSKVVAFLGRRILCTNQSQVVEPKMPPNPAPSKNKLIYNVFQAKIFATVVMRTGYHLMTGVRSSVQLSPGVKSPYVKEERNFLEGDSRNSGEYLRRKLAELNAVQARPSSPLLGLLPATSPVPNEKKKPIKFKDAVGRKFSFPFELCRTWQVCCNPKL